MGSDGGSSGVRTKRANSRQGSDSAYASISQRSGIAGSGSGSGSGQKFSLPSMLPSGPLAGTLGRWMETATAGALAAHPGCDDFVEQVRENRLLGDRIELVEEEMRARARARAFRRGKQSNQARRDGAEAAAAEAEAHVSAVAAFASQTCSVDDVAVAGLCSHACRVGAMPHFA